MGDHSLDTISAASDQGGHPLPKVKRGQPSVNRSEQFNIANPQNVEDAIKMMEDPSLVCLIAAYDQREYAVPDMKTVKINQCIEQDLQFSMANERNVEEVKESKNSVLLQHVFPPNQSIDQSHLSRQHVILRMQLYNTEKKLKVARKKADIKRQKLKMEWDDLEEREKQLKENFISFNKFVQENSEKRSRANKKIQEDLNIINQRQENIKRLEEKTNEVEEVQKAMGMKIKKFLIYKEYLKQIVYAYKEYESIRDVINRFLNLMWSKKRMSTEQRQNLDILQHAKRSMMKLIEDKNFVIMGLNNQIANLQARYENANIKALESEGLVTNIKNNAVKQLGELDTVKNSIWNVYVHMATSKKHPIKIKKDNVEEQMMYINRTLTELSKVNKLIKKKASKAK